MEGLSSSHGPRTDSGGKLWASAAPRARPHHVDLTGVHQAAAPPTHSTRAPAALSPSALPRPPAPHLVQPPEALVDKGAAEHVHHPGVAHRLAAHALGLQPRPGQREGVRHELGQGGGEHARAQDDVRGRVVVVLQEACIGGGRGVVGWGVGWMDEHQGLQSNGPHERRCEGTARSHRRSTIDRVQSVAGGRTSHCTRLSP